MTNTSNIYFYENDKILKLSKNPVLVTVFDIFPCTKSSIKRILNHKHQWVSNSGYYIPSDIKGEWVKVISMCILTLGILSSYRNALAEQKGISLNDEILNQEIDDLLPEKIFQNTSDIMELKSDLIKFLPKLLDNYLAYNFGETESIITNGVAKLFIENVDSLDQQLESDIDPNEQLSLLKFSKNLDESRNTENYILVSIKDVKQNIKINFTNSSEHANHLGRIIFTLVNDSDFKIVKNSLSLNNDDEIKQDVYNFQTAADFLGFYNSLLMEVYFYLDHATVLEHIDEYKLINQSLKAVEVNLEKNLSHTISDFKKNGDLNHYLNSRAQLLNLVHESAKMCGITLDLFTQISNLEELLNGHKLMAIDDQITFKQIQFI